MAVAAVVQDEEWLSVTWLALRTKFNHVHVTLSRAFGVTFLPYDIHVMINLCTKLEVRSFTRYKIYEGIDSVTQIH